MTELVRMVGEAEAAGVLASESSGMAFRHPLIRDVLFGQVSAGMRAA